MGSIFFPYVLKLIFFFFFQNQFWSFVHVNKYGLQHNCSHSANFSILLTHLRPFQKQDGAFHRFYHNK